MTKEELRERILELEDRMSKEDSRKAISEMNDEWEELSDNLENISFYRIKTKCFYILKQLVFKG